MKTDYPRWGWHTLVLANVVIVAVFVAEHWIPPWLTQQPGHAIAFFPPSGVALALCVTGGWRVLPAVMLGSMLLHLPAFWLPEAASGKVAVVTAAMTFAAPLQAGLGALAFRRWIHSALDSVRDVARFLLLTPAMCLIGATCASIALYSQAIVPGNAIARVWFTWWTADTLGVLLGAPLCWIAAGLPRSLWRERAPLVALPLLLASGAAAAGYVLATRWETEQHLGAFRIKAQQAVDTVQAGFDQHIRFVEVVARTLSDHPEALPQEQFQRIAAAYAEGHPELQRVSWLLRVRGRELPAFSAWAHSHLDPAFIIRETGRSGELRPVRPPLRPLYYALVYASPPVASLPLGLDYLGEAQRGDAMRRAMDSGRAAVSVPLMLSELHTPGIVMIRGIGTEPGAPFAALALTLDANRVLQYALRQVGLADIDVELVDITQTERGVLAAGRAFATPRLGEARLPLAFADRRYRLVIAPRASYFTRNFGWISQMAFTIGLLLSALLGALLLLTTGEHARIETQVIDRTARLRDSQARLREREARLQAILDNAAEAIVTVDSKGALLSANAAAERLFGLAAQRLAGQPLAALVPLGDPDPRAALQRLAQAPAQQRELQGRHADNGAFPAEISVTPLRLEDEELYVCILRDLTEQRRSLESIYRLAHYDALTGLVNRHALGARLEEHLAHARRSGEAVGVLFIDLDRFKLINDSYGHEAGDRLLVDAAGRMAELLRHDVDTLARLGGDEFVIVLDGPLTPDSVTTVAVRLVHSLAQPYELAGASVHSGSSVGIALFPDDGADAAMLMRNADVAMYWAKRAGRGNFQFFSESMNAATHEHLRLETRLRAALAGNGLDLHLQPQIELGTGRVIGAEMLLRWEDAELGSVDPARAIAVAEECGLILALGDWVLGRAMAVLADWRRDGMGELRLAVNLSARQFANSALLARLDLLLAENLVDPGCLELEITETAAMRDPESTRSLLNLLHERGFKVAIDDFGTGYSSLAYLKLFPIDRIKIDSAFVHDIETDPDDAAIVAATIGLAHSLGLGVVAEGVETTGQWGFLRAWRSDEAQGFLFARAMPAAEFRTFFKERAQPVPGPLTP
jgi:diguanylate cyclase (GGDEF)-like protein/PAS domain S-box-containing protein